MSHAPKLRTEAEITPPDDEEETAPLMSRDEYEEMMQDLRRERDAAKH